MWIYAQGALLRRQREHNVPLMCFLSSESVSGYHFGAFTVLSHAKVNESLDRSCVGDSWASTYIQNDEVMRKTISGLSLNHYCRCVYLTNPLFRFRSICVKFNGFRLVYSVRGLTEQRGNIVSQLCCISRVFVCVCVSMWGSYFSLRLKPSALSILPSRTQREKNTTTTTTLEWSSARSSSVCPGLDVNNGRL